MCKLKGLKLFSELFHKNKLLLFRGTVCAIHVSRLEMTQKLSPDLKA